MKKEVIKINFPEPITIQSGEVLQVNFNQDLVTGEISHVRTKVLKPEEQMEQPVEDRPVDEIYILGTYDGKRSFKIIDSNGQVHTIDRDPNTIHTINMNPGMEANLFQRAIPAKGCYAPEHRFWLVSVGVEQFTVNDEHVYRPKFNYDTKPGESHTVIHQIGDISTVRTESTHNMTEDPDSQRVKYSTGAQRSAAVEHVRYDLIHPIFAKVLAEVLAEGAAKYGEHNWELGFPIQTLFNHLFAHLFDYLSGDRFEDHLGHAACNVMFLVVEARMREKMHAGHLRLQNCELSPEMIEIIKQFQVDRQKQKEPEQQKRRAMNEMVDEIHRLYTIGALHHRPGCQVPFKELARTYFADRAFSTLRESLETMGYKFDDQDNIIDLEMKNRGT